MDALHYSGGIDATAVLWKLRPQWDNLTVMWVNTGAAYDETIAWMEKIRALVPHFKEVRSDQPGDVKARGFPADIVPVPVSALGRAIHGTSGMVFRPYTECCGNNIWYPMMRATIELGAKVVYRGQRDSDRRKAPIRSGQVDENGICYIFPIEGWTREETFDYVRNECPQLMPAYYEQGEMTSRDCWDCTAYLDDNKQRIKWLPPERRAIVMQRIRVLYQAVGNEMVTLHDLAREVPYG